jgi:hypothetical protein
MVRATFTWQAVANAAGYRIYRGTTQLASQATVGYVAEFDLPYGSHSFSIEAFNASGFGPRATIVRALTQPAPPPVPIPGAVQGFNVSFLVIASPPFPPPAPTGDLYDLGTLPAGYSITWPTLPTTTSQVTVSSAAELTAAVDDGVEITLQAGTYTTSVSLNGVSDIKLIFEAGAQLVGNIDVSNSNRVWLRGPSIRPALASAQVVGRIHGGSGRATDVLIDRMGADATGLAGHAINLYTRLAIIYSRYNSGTRYCVYSDPAIGGSSDLIVAGCDMFADGTESCLRVQDVVRAVIVENRVENTTKHTLRTHYSADKIHVARNIFHDVGWMSTNQGDAPGVIDISFQENVWYWQAGNSLIQHGDDTWTSGDMIGTDNVYYAAAESAGLWFPSSHTGWTLSNNTYGGTFSDFPASNPHW